MALSTALPAVGMPPGVFRIGKSFTFEAGHRLTGLPPEHQCSRQHGHSYTVEVELVADELVTPGFVTDFADLKPFKAFLDGELDHRNLHEILPVEATSELLAQYLAGWFVQHVQPGIPGRLAAVQVRETGSSWARFEVAAP
ncbi:6-carboxytetrahydropterin synthase [Streptomyces kaniharaensis]|uniref:6-carboxy-5,6,7,8-tetrahydropterin synthase n=2 Tax=Streptomyces kaniharaensis TaxID=212423 RepID=A0A6N7L317_9ACTN|nr:6-carboxytetrahydropterin synthase [Streptomyces kaniharaensis]